MSRMMEGIRILEVAEHTFVPAASAILSDWGADVVKVEHAVRGDAMRGLSQTGVMDLSKGVHVLNEHSNRGKRSIGIDLKTRGGLEVLYAIAKTADVFLTNKRPSSLEGLGLGVEALRAVNPNLIYVRGTAFGARGPDANRGGYDMSAYWCRGGSADSLADDESVMMQPGPAYGDSIGAMTIAGGISAALFRRERTGEAPVVDISLLATGMWAMSAGIALSLQRDEPWKSVGIERGSTGNPLSSTYRTSDGRFLCLVMLQAFHYWPDFCRHIDREDLIDDERFTSHEALSANARAAVAEIEREIGRRTLDEWCERFQTLQGQWAPIQSTLEAAADPQVRANGYMQQTTTREGVPFELVATPVQFDEEPCPIARAPEFNEHGDPILEELGFDTERIVELKIEGAIT